MDSTGNQGVQSHGLNFKRKQIQGSKRCQREQAGHLRIEGDQFHGSKIKRTAFSLKASHHALFNDGGAGLREGGFC